MGRVVGDGCSGLAQPREHRGSCWGEGRRAGWLDQWSRFPFQRPASACLGLPSAQGGKVGGAIRDWALPSLSPDLPSPKKLSFPPDTLRSQPGATWPSVCSPLPAHPPAATETREPGAALPRVPASARSPSFSAPRRPGNGRPTRGAAAKPASYSPEPREPCPPGPPCPPTHPPTHPGPPRAPPPRARPVGSLPGPPPHPGAGLSALSCPALGGGAGREGVSVSRARLGTCAGWRSAAGGAPAGGACPRPLPPSPPSHWFRAQFLSVSLGGGAPRSPDSEYE